MAGDVIKSVYESQTDILKGIAALHCPEGFQCDVTFGNGGFWRDMPTPELRFDIDPQVAGVIAASSVCLPLADQSLSNMIFDPPFLTYVRDGRNHNSRTMVMANRFAGYWRYDELQAHYVATLQEAQRVLRAKGVLVFKCQDIVHNHRLHCTHHNVINWAAEAGFRLLDLFVLPAKHRMPSPNRKGAQKHARIFHSYFLVFEKAPIPLRMKALPTCN